MRDFLTKNVEREKLIEILKAAMFSPSARGLRPWEFIIVRDDAIKKRLSKATPYAHFAHEAPLVIVICYDTGKGKRFKEDCSICAANIYLEACNQGVGTCFIQIADAEGNEGNAEDFVRRVLSIPASYRIQCLMPVGYPAKQMEPHGDELFEENKIHFENLSA